MKGDFSRLIRNPGNRFSSVRMQQGRVQLDSDWNEQVDIQESLREQALVDVIGHSGVPRDQADSFKVTEAGSKLDVEGGRIWVEGVLCEREAKMEVEAPIDPDGRYAVYLEVWQRLLTALESPDIVEVALGGPDTTVRTQTACRVGLKRVDGLDSALRCQGVALDDLASKTTGTLKPTTEPGTEEGPCVVPTQAGYARLENQLYRVEVHRSGNVGDDEPPTFKWSRENGSVLTDLLEVDGDSIRIAEKGKDDVLNFPGSGWIELSHDDLDLAGEPGTLVEVTSAPTSSENGGYILDVDRHGQTLIDLDAVSHPKVRRWDHAAGSEDGVEIVADTPFILEGGIKVEFSTGYYRAGDFWLIPARTFVGDFAGDIIWPRDALQSFTAEAPNGVDRHVCKLAIVDYENGAFTEVDDCRPTFPPLTELPAGGGSCCGLSVGNGGDYPTVAEALAALPQDGGEILLLAGTHQEYITLVEVRNVVIRGCGPNSLLLAPDTSRPVIEIRDSTNVTIRSLAIESTRSECVEIEGAETSDVELNDLDLTAARSGAVVAKDGARVAVRCCRVTMSGVARLLDNRQPAVFLAGSELTVEDTAISGVVPTLDASKGTGGGGIQIGGGSSRVRIARNRITGGVNDGITLGSVTTIPGSVDWKGLKGEIKSTGRFDDQRLSANEDYSKLKTYLVNRKRGGTGTYMRELRDMGLFRVDRFEVTNESYLSDGTLSDVEIRDNEIEDTGGSGIAVAHFFGDEAAAIAMTNLRIFRNRITGCRLIPSQVVGGGSGHGEGGIALSHVDGLVVRENVIEGNGLGESAEKLALGACGLYVECTQELTVEGNHIVGNGYEPGQGATMSVGRYGGIVVDFAMAPESVVHSRKTAEAASGRTGSTLNAARIHNNVVEAPAGRALELLAYGAVSVCDNLLSTRFASLPKAVRVGEVDVKDYEQLRDSLGGAVVSILNLGEGNETAWSDMGLANLRYMEEYWDQESRYATGMTMLRDNQIALRGFDGKTEYIPSLVTVAGTDESSLLGNQIVSEPKTVDLDHNQAHIGATAIVLGVTAHVESQRIQEPISSAALSIFSFGFLNTTTDNRTTHCIVSVGSHDPDDQSNVVLARRRQNNCHDAERESRELRDKFFHGGHG